MTVTGAAPGDDRQDRPGAWLGVTAAMQQLQISERTLRRRVATGKLERRTRLDGRLEVWVQDAAEQAVPGAAPDNDRQEEQAERALALVERVNLAVNQQVAPLLAELHAANETIREQAEELGRLRQALAEREARLSVPGNAPDSATLPEIAPETTAEPEATPEPAQRAWWRFW